MDVVAKRNGGGKAHLCGGKRGRAASTTTTTTSTGKPGFRKESDLCALRFTVVVLEVDGVVKAFSNS